MGKEKGRSKKRFAPIVVVAIILSLVIRIGLIGGLGYVAYDELSYSSSHSSSRSSKKDKDKDEDDEDDDDQDVDDDEDDEDDDEDDNGNGNNNNVTPAGAAKWTVLVYMCGTDLESQNGFASLAFDWMDDEAITDDVNIIVETGGTLQWNNEDPYFNGDAVQDVEIPEDMLGRFKIEQGEVIDLGAVELQSMGSADTLSDFISWGVASYPAEKYMFVMWNHGYVEPYGNMEHDEIFYDDNAGGTINSLETNVDTSDYFNDCLNLDEIRQGFEDGGVHFDMIAFNTCLSGSMEVASAVAPYGDYMVASEESIPAIIGLPIEYITYLAENPDCTAEELGNEILALYEEEINDYATQYSSDQDIAMIFSTGTMSMIDLSAMEEIDALMGDLWERIYYSTYNTYEFSAVITQASKCENYGADGNAPGNLIDFRTFLSRLLPIFTDTTVDDELLALIDDNVVSVSGSSRTASCGMSIYFPSAIYPQALRNSYESILSANNISYTEDEMDEIISRHLDYSLTGYIDNIDFIDGYYWYAAYLEVRFSEYWTTSSAVWSNVDSNADPNYANQTQISATASADIEYDILFDDNGNVTLDITSGSDMVLSVEANACYYLATDNAYSYTLFGSEMVYPDSANGTYSFNPNCEWFTFDGHVVTVYIVEDTDDHTIYATPADVNEVWSFIYFYFDKTTGEYSLLHCAVIDPTTGVATNDLFTLQDGDSVEFMYYSIMATPGFNPRLFIRGLFDPVEFDGDFDIRKDDMFTTGSGEKILLVNFLIRDSFGEIIDTVSVEIVYGDDNSIVSVQEAQGYLDYTNLYEVTTVWV
ncbi:hypothetical protein SAMN06296952_2396 [Oscillospiraceae bacterium]|nr:hypothetical protein SAMN06296952_2396 [Oscillospiraceae bacterium]